jgi:hypothetical protein
MPSPFTSGGSKLPKINTSSGYVPLAGSKKKSKKETKQDQPFYLDVLDFIQRPQRAFTGGLANITDKDRSTTLLGGVLGGISGREKKDFDEVLNNMGWKQSKAGSRYNVFGTKGALDLFDIVSFVGDTALDPLTYLTLGGTSAAKAGAKSAYQAVKDAGFDVTEAVTSRGQRKAIEDVAQKQSQNLLEKLMPKTGESRTQKVTGSGKGTRVVDEGLEMVDGVKVDPKLNQRLVLKLAEKKKQDVMKIAGDAAKAGREKAQNALINIDVPFFNILKSFGTKPAWLKTVDPKIGVAQIAKLNQLFEEAGITQRQRDLLDDPEVDDAIKENIIKRIGATPEQKMSIIKQIAGVDKIEDLTRQDLLEIQRRLREAKLKPLDNVGQTQTVNTISSMEPARQNMENLVQQMEVLMSTKYADEMEELRRINPELSDNEILNKIIRESNMPKKVTDIDYIDTPVSMQEAYSKNYYNRLKSIPKDVRDLMESISVRLNATGEANDIFTQQFLDILKSLSKKPEDTKVFKTFVRDLNNKRKSIIEKIESNIKETNETVFEKTRKSFEQNRKKDINKVIEQNKKDRKPIIEKYKKQYDAIKETVRKRNLNQLDKINYLKGVKREIELLKKAELEKLNKDFNLKKSAINKKAKEDLDKRLKTLEKGFKNIIKSKTEPLLKKFDEDAEVLKANKLKELTDELKTKNKDYLEKLKLIDDNLGEDIAKNFVKKRPAYKNIIKEVQKLLRDPSRQVKVGYNKDINETLFANPKGVDIGTLRQKQNIDVVDSQAVENLPNMQTAVVRDADGNTIDTVQTFNRNFQNLDTSRFVRDMGGESVAGKVLRRYNLFNARTFRSEDAAVEATASMGVDKANQMKGRERDIEKQINELTDAAKKAGLTDEEIQLIPYMLEKVFPDEYFDDVAKAGVMNDLKKLSQLRESVDVLKADYIEKAAKLSADKKDIIEKLKDLTKERKSLKKGSDDYKASMLKTEKLQEDLVALRKIDLKKENLEKLTKIQENITKQKEKIRINRIKGQPAIDEVLNQVTDGDAEKIAALKGIAKRFESIFANMARLGVEAGTMDKLRKNYYAHVINLTDKDFNDIVKRYQNDPEIGELVRKKAKDKFAQERTSFQTMADLDNKLVELQNRLDEMGSVDSEEYQKLSERIEVLSNLFERDPFKALAKRSKQAIKSVAMRQLQNQMAQDGLLLRSTDAIPDGYVQIKPEQFKALGLAEEFKDGYINQEVLDGINRSQNIFTDRGIENVLRSAESVTNIWKTLTTSLVPSHYWFNFMGNLANNVMAGVGLDAYAEAGQLMKAYKNGTLTPEQESIIQQALDNGVLNQTSFADLMGTASLQTGQRNKLEEFEKFMVDNRVTQSARQYVGDPIDNLFRLAHYVDVLKKTYSPQLAAESVRKHLFNYSELTKADRITKAFVPFWNWTKNNIPLQLNKFLTKPRYAIAYARLKDQSQGDLVDDPTIPSWLKESYIKVGDNSFYNLRLPLQDLATLYGFDSETFARLGGMQTPFLRVPQELALNKQYFGDRYVDFEKLGGGEYNNATVAQYLGGQFGGVLNRVGNLAVKDIPNQEDNKNILDNLRDFFTGKTVNLKQE